MSALSDIIEEAYDVFSRYRPRGQLHVCFCPCCMTPEQELQLRKTPLREIASPLLSEYTNSAHAWNPNATPIEVRYFLPRYFELIAQDAHPSFIGPETTLSKLQQEGWRENWPAHEIALIESFFVALVTDIASRAETLEQSGHFCLKGDLDTTLTMLLLGGANVDALLAAWDAAPDPAAAAHMAAAQWSVSVDDGGQPYLRDAFLEGATYSEPAHKIGAFLRREDTIDRMTAAFFATEDAGLQAVLSHGIEDASLTKQ